MWRACSWFARVCIFFGILIGWFCAELFGITDWFASVFLDPFKHADSKVTSKELMNWVICLFMINVGLLWLKK